MAFTERNPSRSALEGAPLVMRFRLTDTLQPGSEAAAVFLRYNPNTDAFVELSSEHVATNVHATFHRAFGVTGEEGWAMLHADSRRWEVISMEGSLVRPGVAGGTIAAGATGSVTVDGVVITANNWSTDIAVASGDKVLVFYSPVSQTWYFVKSGGGAGGGGGGAGSKLYYGPLYADLNASDASVNVNGLTSLTTGVADVGGLTSCGNPWNWFGRTGDTALVIKDEPGALYYIVEVRRREETLECYVYTPFNKDTQTFTAIVVRSYSNYTAVGAQIVVYNQEDFDPGADNPYLFEGENYAVCRVQYDPMSSRYRAVWVECPEETPEVAAQLNLSQNDLFFASEGAFSSGSAF